MSVARKSAMLCHGLVAALMFAFAARYLFGERIMPYHLQVLGVAWEDLPANYRFMFRGFMNGVGIGMLATGWSMLVLLWVPYRRGEPWADWGLVSVGLVSQVPMLFLVARVDANSGASPPLGLSAAMVCVTLSGFVLSRLGRARP